MNYTTKQLAEITGSKLVGDENLVIKTLAFDSRNIYSVAQTAFLAITTSKSSGEKYIPAVVGKGIQVIISENEDPSIENVTWIITENSLDFVQKLAKAHVAQFPLLTTVGITGSNGKTIIKEWLYQSLADDFSTVKSPKSFNSQLGLPLSLLQISNRHQIGLFEVGISKPGEMEKIEKIFQPKIGILTHIGSAHAANFKDEKQLIREKLKLFQQSETIFYNGDHPQVVDEMNRLYSDRHLISYGLSQENDISIVNEWQNKNENIIIKCFDETFELSVQQRDEATLNNALCVIGLLRYLNYSFDEIIEKINSLKAVEMRLESVNGLRNNIIINDSFNLDLDSLIIAFQFIQEYNKPKKSLVITDFVEGKNTDELYHEVVELTNQQNFDKIFLVGTEISTYQSLFTAETFTFINTRKLIESQSLNQLENELILLKGARKFEIERVKNYLELQKHDTVLEVNLNAIINNINVHKALLHQNTKVMAMVKAYSYGLGGYEIAEFLQHHHIDYLGVAYADEGVHLRKNGITVPIMVMNPEQHSYDIIIDYDLGPEIYSFRVLDLFVEQLKRKGYNGKYPIHIKLETGMHRLGFKTEELPLLVEILKNYPVKVVSIFSHLATADVPEERDYALFQIKLFQKNAAFVSEGLQYKPTWHILNSAGITDFTEYQFDMVRIGLGMIGISGNPEIQSRLQSVARLKTVISQISTIEKGDTVGYSRRFKAEHETRVATLPVGYADGIPRLIGNGIGQVGIHGQLMPIIGNICMDMMMVDCGNFPVKEGDEVTVFNSHPTLEEFARYCQTIPYEVLTSISRRVKRIYIKN